MTVPAWLLRWQQTDEDELLYTPQYSGALEIPDVSADDRAAVTQWLRTYYGARWSEDEDE